MDILLTYTCLLIRPRVHYVEVIPSTLHQKLKFIIGDKLIIAFGEEDLLVSEPLSTRYIKVVEKALKYLFKF